MYEIFLVSFEFGKTVYSFSRRHATIPSTYHVIAVVWIIGSCPIIICNFPLCHEKDGFIHGGKCLFVQTMHIQHGVRSWITRRRQEPFSFKCRFSKHVLQIDGNILGAVPFGGQLDSLDTTIDDYGVFFQFENIAPIDFEFLLRWTGDRVQ